MYKRLLIVISMLGVIQGVEARFFSDFKRMRLKQNRINGFDGSKNSQVA